MIETPQGHAAGSYAPVNGLSLYYEVHGTGKPLVLLHGGFGVIGMFAAFEHLLPTLAKAHQVIDVELQGHGHTGDIDRPLSYEGMADDIAALIEHLGLANADLCGYSLGGGVALQTAIRHPDVVRKLVVVSAPCKRAGWYPEVLAGMAAITPEALVGTPMHAAYLRVAPNPEDWPRLANKTRQLLGQDYDWSTAVAAIEVPTLIVVGDADSVRPAHAVEFFGLLGGGKGDGDMRGLPASALAVLPATTHMDILTRVDLLLSIIPPFLDAPMPDA
jgi:pimeloyl-ACP methyl ester carboxylesterase